MFWWCGKRVLKFIFGYFRLNFLYEMIEEGRESDFIVCEVDYGSLCVDI